MIKVTVTKVLIQVEREKNTQSIVKINEADHIQGVEVEAKAINENKIGNLKILKINKASILIYFFLRHLRINQENRHRRSRSNQDKKRKHPSSSYQSKSNF